MKTKEFLSDIKSLSVKDLKDRRRQLAEELMKLRFRKASGQLEQSHQLALARKNLARIKTVLSSKERE